MDGRRTRIEPQTATLSDPDLPGSRPSKVDDAKISARAYELWVQRGCPIGSPETDWFRAEQELKGHITKAA